MVSMDSAIKVNLLKVDGSRFLGMCMNSRGSEDSNLMENLSFTFWRTSDFTERRKAGDSRVS